MVRHFKGSAGISIATLLLPDQFPGECKRGERGRKGRIRSSQRTRGESADTVKRELVPVNTLFISPVRSGVQGALRGGV